MLNFVFEKLIPGQSFMALLRKSPKNIVNFYQGNSKLFSSSWRFTVSPLMRDIFEYDFKHNTKTARAYTIEQAPDNYIISTGVGHDPDHWTGSSKYSSPVLINDYSNKDIPSLFDLLEPKYLKDLQDNRAWLLIDQSHEGYHRPWLWNWFHEECDRLSINPNRIIYVTGDQSAKDTYNSNGLKIIQATTLKSLILDSAQETDLNIDFDQLLEYKQTHLASIKLYDCINKRPRNQRIYNYLHLVKHNLTDDGYISMDVIEPTIVVSERELTKNNLSLAILDQTTQQLPSWVDKPNNTEEFFYYETRILQDLYRNTWVSLVTESSYFEYENSIFISEKTFKPIICLQPFIIVGSRGVLAKLRALGYKTFSGWIDESYDDCDDAERFTAIMRSLEQIKQIPDKLAWLESMRDVLEHNRNLLISYYTNPTPEHLELIEYVQTV